jgi:gamma-glutamylcyclotransferase (GGCT)/AIG2-like uncharacterized protein YtfP
MTHKVAVYGTLKRGETNFYLMQDARFLGTDELTQITLYDLGPYPGARQEESEGVEVEVFEVSEAQFAALDVLEDYVAEAPASGLYDRRQFPTRFGVAWVYLYNPSVAGFQSIRRGGWQRLIAAPE